MSTTIADADNANEAARREKLPVTVSALQLENVKRIKCVEMQLATTGLTVVGGDNAQGKTSVLDAIAYALGGERRAPSDVDREGSVLPASIRIELSNGLVVERKGKKHALKVTDTAGAKGGQALLNAFIHQFALDLPRFMDSTDAEKTRALLEIIGVGEDLAKIDREEKAAFDRRHEANQHAKRSQAHADSLPYIAGAPDEVASVADIMAEHAAATAHNAEQARLRTERDGRTQEQARIHAEVLRLKKESARLQSQNDAPPHPVADIDVVNMAAKLASIEDDNAKARANLDKAKATEDAKHQAAEVNRLSGELEAVRIARRKLLDGAELPLPGLGVKDAQLTYHGKQWDCISGAEQLKVATAIVRKLNPQCGFVLIDKLEAMDLPTLNAFSDWLKIEGLQAIATRVSTGPECSIIIEDGSVKRDAETKATASQFQGEF
jgi:hypothetical protein